MAVEKLVLIVKRPDWLNVGYSGYWYEYTHRAGESWVMGGSRWRRCAGRSFDYYWTPTDCWLFTSEGRDFVLP